MTQSCGLLQFKGMNKAQNVWPIPAVGRSPALLSDYPVWKITEPAVALGLLEVIFLPKHPGQVTHTYSLAGSIKLCVISAEGARNVSKS